LLYRNVEDVAGVIDGLPGGRITMDYQPGIRTASARRSGRASCAVPAAARSQGAIAGLKAAALPYPPALRDALLHRFQWEVLFAIENAELAAASGEQTTLPAAPTGRWPASRRCCFG
jgi:hypothetical protein